MWSCPRCGQGSRELMVQLVEQEVRREKEQFQWELERERRETERERQLRNGTYYSTVDQVWGAKAEPYSSDDFNNLRRTTPPRFILPFNRTPSESSAPSCYSSGAQFTQETTYSYDARAIYRWTRECALNERYGVARDAAATTATTTYGHDTSTTELALWPVDIFGDDPNSTSRVAHLLPAGQKVAELYRDVAICALALEDDDSGWVVLQKAIHGCAVLDGAAQPKKRKRESALVGAPVNEDEKREAMGEGRRSNRFGSSLAAELALEGDTVGRVGESGGKTDDSERTAEGREQGPSDAAGSVAQDSQMSTLRRVRRTGIKHFVPNKIRLAGQADYLDRKPCVLIVPVMDLDEMKRWSGGGYKAIVMVKGLGKWDGPRAICRAINMQLEGPTAEADDIEKARTLLSEVVKGLAYSLFKRLKGGSAIELDLDVWQRGELSALRDSFANPSGDRVMVPVPKAREAGQAPPRVRIVTFGQSSAARSDDLDDTVHPAPDPLLLAVRAAVNWSAQNHQRLLPSAEPKDVGDYVDSDDECLDRVSEEEYLQGREVAWGVLGRRRGQPHGYKSDDDDDDDDDSSTAPSELDVPFNVYLNRLPEEGCSEGHEEEPAELAGDRDQGHLRRDDDTTGREAVLVNPAVLPETAPPETAPARETSPPEAALRRSIT